LLDLKKVSQYGKLRKRRASRNVDAQRIASGTQEKTAGRPLLLVKRMIRVIFRIVLKPRALTSRMIRDQIINVLKVDVSTRTVRRALHSLGLIARARPFKPRLLPKHIKERLRFARSIASSINDDWEKVMFTDESKFNLYMPDGPYKVYRVPG